MSLWKVSRFSNPHRERIGSIHTDWAFLVKPKLPEKPQSPRMGLKHTLEMYAWLFISTGQFSWLAYRELFSKSSIMAE